MEDSISITELPTFGVKLSGRLYERLSLDIKFTRKHIANIGMASSLPVSIIGGFLGVTRVHVAASIAFVGFLGLHLYGRKRII